ncbi:MULTISPECIES: bifunctional hydroxymethylpyrimidine kinase/phosphomethylpyrimidine kinase [Weeksella]|uniref:hydroxymethylpyrimidine kinase n=1 Tax=Weeksella virosa (strain ATCC 43766 / DSM 16922 / JCM 21250 / CCUG 30538 / CDC 9751 / IAM 14551 / NBRC 16016 / NCTC 11634 / CL345/78) TaxID=865938 RepID=F0NY93_WEEVC|nr:MULTISPECIES: bifunctional hydroxymethylpyrimidine kinase/phosphomethylpyrimidine kinase [Weeksella]ADX68090.1 phosphomethylpyrimidine kinase [Weeksella virosa DSM 16922]MDK7374927.1 bifunctional hydroxymethylpyrimidine kinase/phosphomethylpyrimidine kinase [Weeksella virosa]MDK7675430.1 bifunctional hydroxymethylpyrimidine kinase/phosphomethylpyrimidine kinase [Weeksella virosa]OFM83879.1 hydroxymethylpyrimidine/phosphomethylpyrimidine kinase [Weeksella sp. HMSC059D05]SUP54401.1 Hydroxymet
MNTMQKPYSVLTIAGYDGSGGAGIQADTKTISAHGCYATNVLTALPVQNTKGVQNIYEIPAQAIREQILSILEDIYPDAIKIGMVHSVELVHIISEELKNYNRPIVYDPVMVATSGHRLIKEETLEACIEKLFPLATLITPNLDEASILVNHKIDSAELMLAYGETILNLGCQNLLIKGGHLQQEKIISYLFQKEQPVQSYTSQKIKTKNTHGSGCTLSSAIACNLALGYSLTQSVQLAQEYVEQAILGSKDLAIGKGNGPLNHLFNPQKLKTYDIHN